VAATLGLHGRRYTSPEFAALEREQVLLNSWQLACHVSDLPAAGTAMRFDFAGRSAVVLRGKDGVIRAYLNVCRHRGSRIVDGDPLTGLAFCVAGRLRCPYHGWEYDETGALAYVPDEDRYPGIERTASGLQPIAVETWLGFVFIAFERPPRSLAEILEPVRVELEAHRFESLRRLGEPHVQRYQADWKLLCEHRLDTYHLRVARPVLKPLVGRSLEFAACGEDVLRLTARIEGESAATWSARAYSRWLPALGELPDERRRLWSSYFVWPNLALNVYPDQVVVAQVMPVQPGESLSRTVAYALPDVSREMRLVRYLNRRISRHASLEDRRMVERTQQGIASGDAWPGPLADDERGLLWFTGRMRYAVPATEAKRASTSRFRKRGP
jgi:phenylpropionate dioxygenase-like ring-hydroxylating dioxygenase large terminal subunit